VLRPTKRYWRIYSTFWTSSLRRELEYRANFFAKIANNVVWIAFFVLVLLVIYGRTESVAGWSRSESLILGATVFVQGAVAAAFFFSLQEIPQQVRLGTLDFVIVKPVDSQFWVSSRRFLFDQIGTILAGIAMLVVGVVQQGAAIGADQWAAYFILSLSGLLLLYAFNLALMTTGIWFVRVDNLWVLVESVQSVARYPMDIYSAGVQRVFTFILPLAFFATIPTRQLLGPPDWNMVGLGVVWAASSMIGARLFWRFALKHYASASS
jgi:ABC-2 type transport system permease protein